MIALAQMETWSTGFAEAELSQSGISGNPDTWTTAACGQHYSSTTLRDQTGAGHLKKGFPTFGSCGTVQQIPMRAAGGGKPQPWWGTGRNSKDLVCHPWAAESLSRTWPVLVLCALFLCGVCICRVFSIKGKYFLTRISAIEIAMRLT